MRGGGFFGGFFGGAPGGGGGGGEGGLFGGLGLFGGAAAEEGEGQRSPTPASKVLSPTTSPNRQLQQPAMARWPSPAAGTAQQQQQRTPSASPGLPRRQSGALSPSRLASLQPASVGQRTPAGSAPASAPHSQHQSPVRSPSRLLSGAGTPQQPHYHQQQSPGAQGLGRPSPTAASPVRQPTGSGSPPRPILLQPLELPLSPGQQAQGGFNRSPAKSPAASPQGAGAAGVEAAAVGAGASRTASPNPLAKLVRRDSPARLVLPAAMAEAAEAGGKFGATPPSRSRPRVAFFGAAEEEGGGAHPAARGPSGRGTEASDEVGRVPGRNAVACHAPMPQLCTHPC